MYTYQPKAFNFQYNISFIDPPLKGFGEILSSVTISPLWVIFRRILLAPGLYK